MKQHDTAEQNSVSASWGTSSHAPDKALKRLDLELNKFIAGGNVEMIVVCDL